MKKLTLLLIGILIFGFTYSQTTLEEYNYLTIGYEKDIKNGRDIKAGYELEEFFSQKIKKYTYTYYYFNELETGKTKAILIVLEKPKKDKVRYLCLPLNNGALLERFFNKHEMLGVTMIQNFDMTIFTILQDLFDNYKNGAPLNLKAVIKE